MRTEIETALALDTNQDVLVGNLRETALFFIDRLRFEGFKRKDVVQSLRDEFDITSANAAYYVDRVAKI